MAAPCLLQHSVTGCHISLHKSLSITWKCAAAAAGVEDAAGGVRESPALGICARIYALSNQFLILINFYADGSRVLL